MKTQRWVRAIQVAASLAVLWALARDLDGATVEEALRHASLGWLIAAMAVKGLGLAIHELRLWLCLPAPRPPAGKVFALGFLAGMMNLVLPARGGDLLAIALLNRDCGVRPTAATAAVGLVAFLEAAVFGVFLAVVLALGASQWIAVIGAAAQSKALWMVGGITGAGILGVWVLGRLGRGEKRLPGPLALVRQTAADGRAVMNSPQAVLLHVGLAVLRVAFTLGGFTLALPAAGLSVPVPWLAASGVLALSSVAAVALPPTFAAGPAATSVAVLAVFGVDRAGALAYAGAYWLVAHVPAVVLGLPWVWLRRADPPAGGRTI